MRTALAAHPMIANWRTNLLFPLFPQSGPRDPNDTYGGKTPGKYFCTAATRFAQSKLGSIDLKIIFKLKLFVKIDSI